MTEQPDGIEEAEEAALALERAIGAPPRVASPAYLDAVGAATRRLELALGEPAARRSRARCRAGRPARVERVRSPRSRRGTSAPLR